MGKHKRKSRGSSSTDEEERLLRKCRKMIRKNRHKRKARHRSRSYSAEASDIEMENSSHSEDGDSEVSTFERSPSRVQSNTEPVETNLVASSSALIDVENNKEEAKEKELRDDILNVIGQRLAEERKLAPPVHSSFAVRWGEIVKLGLSSEERTSLIKKYPPAENCTFLDSPKLNVEVSRAMTDVARSRDLRIIDRHSELAACIAGLGQSLTVLLERDVVEDLPLIEALSDVSRLLANSLYGETSVRRKLTLANVNSAMKETLNASSSDNFLFGNQLSENIKTAKIIDQSAAALKAPKVSVSHMAKNFKAPPRHLVKPTPIQGGQKQTTNHQQYSQRGRQYRQQLKHRYTHSRSNSHNQSSSYKRSSYRRQ